MSEFVTRMLLPLGLFALMYSLGLSLNLMDFQRLLRFPRALFAGLVGQLVGLPAIAFLIALTVPLPPELAISLIVIAACPAGVTGNVLAFIGRADVALSIAITTVSSFIGIITTPLFIMLALRTFHPEVELPMLDFRGATSKLFLFTAPPIIAGLATRLYLPGLAIRLLLWLRPAAFGILLTTITFSVLTNWTMVSSNIVGMGPVALLMNAAAMALGLWLSQQFVLSPRQRTTLVIELGVQNATMATFVAVALLQRSDLAAAPTIYGIIMVVNALLVMPVARRFPLP